MRRKNRSRCDIPNFVPTPHSHSNSSFSWKRKGEQQDEQHDGSNTNHTTAGLPSWTSHRLYRTMTSPSTLPSSLPSAGQTPVSITVSYWIPNDPQQQDEPCSSTSSSSSSSSTPTKTETWDASAVPLAVLGLPAGRTPVKVCTVGGYSY